MPGTTMPIAVYRTLSPILCKKVICVVNRDDVGDVRRISVGSLVTNAGVSVLRTTVEEEEEECQIFFLFFYPPRAALGHSGRSN